MKTKYIIIITGLMLIGLMAEVFYSFYSEYSVVKNISPPVEISQDKNISEPTVSDKQNTDFTDFTKLDTDRKIVCESCHFSGKNSTPQAYLIKPHVEGGAYCLKCHIIDHNVHPINNNVTCQRCHGSSVTPQVPEYRDGKIVCDECHDYPDPYKPANGNLVKVHKPRNIDCIKCHLDASDSCKKCHAEVKNDSKWNKRLTHFNTIMKIAK